MAVAVQCTLVLSLCAMTSCFINLPVQHTIQDGRDQAFHSSIMSRRFRSVAFGKSRVCPFGVPRFRDQLAMQSESIPAGVGKISVSVVGGGPAGLAAALNLLDIPAIESVTIIEKAPMETFSDGPGTWGVGVGKRCRKVLDDMTGSPWGFIKDRSLFSEYSGFYRASRPIIREGIYSALIKEYGNSGRLNFEFGTTVAKFDSPSKCLDLDNGKKVKYDFLCLADGVHSSSVRSLGLPQLEPEKLAFWNCLKIMPAPAIPGDHSPYMMSSPPDTDGKKKSSAWLLPKKDGSRYCLVYFNPKDGFNPGGMQSTAELRALLQGMTLAGSAPAEKSKKLRQYILDFPEEELQGFLEREPRAMWTSRTSSAVDESKGIVLLGDTAGACLPTLGQGTCMALLDAKNFADSVRVAVKSAEDSKGGSSLDPDGAEGLVRAALTHYTREGERERKAMVDLNILCMMIRNKWSKVPLLGKLDKWVTDKVEDPDVRLASIYRKPFVFPLVHLARRKWAGSGMTQEADRDWRAGWEAARRGVVVKDTVLVDLSSK